MDDKRRKTDSGQCPHPSHHYDINMASFGDTNIRYLEIKGRCTVCEAPVRFRGLPYGMSPMHPTMRIGGSDVTLPIMHGDEEYDGDATGFVGREVI